MFLRAKIACIILLTCSCALMAFANDAPADSGCPRNEPAPVFSTRSQAILTQSFRRVDGAGTEVLRLKSGQTIRVKNWGCEYYVVTFLVEPTATGRNLGVRAAYELAADWLVRIKELGANLPFDLELAARTLRRHYREARNLAFDSEIAVESGGSDFLQTKVMVEQPDEGRKAGAIQFSIFTGPL